MNGHATDCYKLAVTTEMPQPLWQLSFCISRSPTHPHPGPARPGPVLAQGYEAVEMTERQEIITAVINYL